MEPQKKKVIVKKPVGESLKGVEDRSFYWIKCWDVKEGFFRRRRYYYTIMHSNGNKLGTSQGIDTRVARDGVVKGILEKGIHFIQWVDSLGVEIGRDFKVN
jgi:hypothetical protein